MPGLPTPAAPTPAAPMHSVPLYTAEQVRAAEAPLLAAGEPLMDIAAAALARIAAESLAEFDAADGSPRRPRVLVLAGSGNNGGDALFAAARLAGRAEVELLPTSSRRHEAGFAAALAAGAREIDLAGLRARIRADGYDLVLDGVLGIGTAADPALRGEAREAVLELLPSVRSGRSRVLAVDLPSGLHPDTGDADDAVLPAATTVTFGAVKRGLARGRGPELSGGIVLVDIGLGEGLAGVTPSGRAQVSRIL